MKTFLTLALTCMTLFSAAQSHTPAFNFKTALSFNPTVLAASDNTAMIGAEQRLKNRLAVVLDMMASPLRTELQAQSHDEGYPYPGPAVHNVPVSMAPKRSQEVIAEFERPEYASLIADKPIELPLKPEQMVLAFQR